MNRKLFLLCLILLNLSGCMARLKSFHRGDTVPAGNMLIVGRLVMDPYVHVSKGPTAIVGDTYGTILLLFTERPTDPFTRAAHAKFFANGPQGGVFAFVAPRQPLYLRGLYIMEFVGGGLTGNQQVSGPRVGEVLCTTNMTIEPRPEDQVIYVGAIYCHHAQETPEARVYDDWKNSEPELRSYTDTSRVKMRFPKAR